MPTTLVLEYVHLISKVFHYTEYTDGTRATAVGAGAIVLLLEMLVMGLAIKMWTVGPDTAAGSDQLDDQADFLGAAVVVQVVTKAIYTLYAYFDWPTALIDGRFPCRGPD